VTPEDFVKWAKALSEAVRSWIGTAGLLAAFMVSVGWGNCQRIEAQRSGQQFNSLLGAVKPLLLPAEAPSVAREALED
jgi:hypothetical protein